MENITGGDCRLVNSVLKNFGIKSRSEYYSLYVQSNKEIQTDVFENFRDMHLKN